MVWIEFAQDNKLRSLLQQPALAILCSHEVVLTQSAIQQKVTEIWHKHPGLTWTPTDAGPAVRGRSFPPVRYPNASRPGDHFPCCSFSIRQ